MPVSTPIFAEQLGLLQNSYGRFFLFIGRIARTYVAVAGDCNPQLGSGRLFHSPIYRSRSHELLLSSLGRSAEAFSSPPEPPAVAGPLACGGLWACARVTVGRNGKGIRSVPKIQAVRGSKDKFTDLIKNSYRILLTRGLKGCYVYFMDKDTERFVKSRIEN